MKQTNLTHFRKTLNRDTFAASTSFIQTSKLKLARGLQKNLTDIRKFHLERQLELETSSSEPRMFGRDTMNGFSRNMLVPIVTTYRW
jgi:hypothetical protein